MKQIYCRTWSLNEMTVTMVRENIYDKCLVTVNGCKDVSIMSPQMNSEFGQVYSVCILQFSCFTRYNRIQSKHKQTKFEHSRLNSYILQLSQ